MAGGGSAHREPGAGHSWRGTRRRLLLLAGGAGAALLSRVGPARAAFEPLLTSVRVASDGHPYAGDRAALATIGGPGRRSARLHFTLNRRANVSLEVLQTGQGAVSEKSVPVATAALSENETMFGPGSHTLDWAPPGESPSAHLHPPAHGDLHGWTEPDREDRRAAARRRRGIRKTQRAARRSRDARHAHRRQVAQRPVAAQRPGDRAELRQRRDQGHRDGSPGRGELEREGECTGARSCCRSLRTGRPASTSSSSPPTTAGSGTRR